MSDVCFYTPAIYIAEVHIQAMFFCHAKVVKRRLDYPRELTVQVSDDNLSWRTAWRQDDFDLCWENEQPRFLYWEHYSHVR